MGSVRLLLVALIIVAVANSIEEFRLPRTLWPQLYTLEIVTFIGCNDCNFTFQGQVWIEMDCVQTTKIITLHAKDLNISSPEVWLKNDKDPKHTDIIWKRESPNTDFYSLGLSKQLVANNSYILYMKFSGQLLQGLAGFYRSSYNDRTTGETRWLAVTQFESTDARRAFPCFDEPEFKAKFKLMLGHVPNYTTLSNMNMISSEPMLRPDGWMMDIYQVSEKMSTYLVAYFISDMEFYTSEETHVMFRVWARKDAIHQTRYAAEVGPKVLSFFEEFFDIPYPLPKQDMIAIPDFNSGAMENWGLITYREAVLLHDPHLSSINSKETTASVVSHELAHQWFGNLVTMKWWSDLWLNEGFATYISELGVDHVEPNWNTLQIQAVENFLTVFEFDSLHSSHPMSVKLKHPSEISQIFDSISYKKGALMLRMMHLFLGKEVFRNGVSKYLQTHHHGNAEQDDLWLALTEEAHKSYALDKSKTIKTIMDTWTLQTGYPIVTVKRNYKIGIVEISQKRYLSDRRNNSEHGHLKDENSSWIIPIVYTTEFKSNFEDTIPNLWLTPDEPSAILNNVAERREWIILNINMAGLFRVNYDKTNWHMLGQTLDSKNYTRIGVLNRVQLIDDVMNLARTGDIEYETALQVINYLHHETEYLPWRAAFNSINKLYKLLHRTTSMIIFRRYLSRLMATSFEQLGDKMMVHASDSHEIIKHHQFIVKWACILNIGDCVRKARNMYENWMLRKNPTIENPISPEMRSYVYCTAIKYGSEEEWNFAWEHYLNSNVGSEKLILLSSLGCTREVWLLKKLLEWTLNEDYGIRRQDCRTVFIGVAVNEVGYPIAKNFLIKRIREIHDSYGSKSNGLAHYFTTIAAEIYEEDEAKQFQEFIKNNEMYLEGAKLAVKQALETIDVNIQWHHKNYKTLISLLELYTR